MKRLLACVVVGAHLLLISCSHEIENSLGGENQLTAEGYAKVTLCLPDQSGEGMSRSDGTGSNDVFADGESYEFNISNGIIAFFEVPKTEKNPDQDATLVKAYDLSDLVNGWNKEGTVTNQLTVRKSLICKAPKPTVGNQLFALAVLNTNRIIQVNSEGVLLVKGYPLSRFSELQKAIQLSVEELIGGSDKNEFFMTNAPIADRSTQQPGNEFQPRVTTLVPVTVYESEQEAHTAVTDDRIYVERSVAKVEVSARSNATIHKDGSVTYTVVDENGRIKPGHTVTFHRWCLNVTNKSTKLVRDVTGYEKWATYVNPHAESPLNRFFGSTPNPYRVYWAVDGNYADAEALKSATYREKQFHYVNPTAEQTTWNTLYSNQSGKVNTRKAYCLENTMVASHMKDKLMTGVLLEATYQITDNKDPYGDLFTLGSSPALFSTTDLLTTILQILHLPASANLTFDRSALAGGTMSTFSDFEAFKVDGKSLTETQIKSLLTHPSVGKIHYYKEGRTYYYTRPIRHFSDYYTPVTKNTDYTEEEHLGRFGVVRNHWYEIIIGEVMNPGYPEIPDFGKPDPNPNPNPNPPMPDQPKPELEDPSGMLNVQVKIRQWTIRWQSIDF